MVLKGKFKTNKLAGKITALILIVAMAATSVPLSLETAAAASKENSYAKFSGGLLDKERLVSEKPSEVFQKPYLYMEKDGVQIWCEKNLKFEYPFDDLMAVDLLFVNTTEDYMELQPEGDPSLTGKLAAYTEKQLFIFHPNPLIIRMNPKESVRATLTVSFGNRLRNDNTKISEKSVINQKLKLWKRGSDGTVLGNMDLAIKVNSTVYPLSYMNDKKNRNSTIKINVKDSKGKFLNDLEVEVAGGFNDGQMFPQSNKKAAYTVKVFAGKNNYYNTWHTYRIIVKKNGYQTVSQDVRPVKGKTVTCNIVMQKDTGVKYKLTKKQYVGVTINGMDKSADGKLIAMVPFHSALQESEIQKDAYMYITNPTGTKTKRVYLGGETPWVDVSDDGKYIVVERTSGDMQHNIITIYDSTGENIVYEREKFPVTDSVWSQNYQSDSVFIKSRCQQLSPDNSKLIVGGNDGDVYCIDWKNDKVLWTENVKNQVRTITFSKDGKKVYISSGDGYMYCFGSGGNFIWRSYIGSWGECVIFTQKYIVLSPKNSMNSLRILDVNSGKQLWSYDTGSTEMIAVSADGKMMWVGDGKATATRVTSGQVFDLEACASGKTKILWSTNTAGMVAAFSKNGKYLAVKGTRELCVYDAKKGGLLWKAQVTNDDTNNNSNLISISDDGKNIIASFNAEGKKEGYAMVCYFKKK